MPTATHLIKIWFFMVRPPGIPKEDKAGLRGYIIGLLEGKMPKNFDLENIEIEEA